MIGLLIPLLGLVWVTSDRTVTLVVNGQAETIRTHAATVEDLLERSGVAVSADDLVHPAPDSPVVDGMLIEVVHAREIALLVGGVEERVVVTALTVSEVLEEFGLIEEGPRRAGLVRPSRLSRVRSGMVVELSRPVALRVVHDGRTREVITDEATVGEVLARLGVTIGALDRVTPGLDVAPDDGMEIVVQRVEVVEQVRAEPIPFDTEERPAETLERGQRREAESGADGQREIVESVTLVDGVEEARERVTERIVAEPRLRIVEVGTAPPPEPEPEPEPVPAEPPEEVEVADVDATDTPAEDASNRQEGKASWYDNPFGGMTAAHRSLPRGTIVTVTNLANGKQVQVRINDRGPYVDGRIIDLNREAFAKIATPSRGIARVRIEW